jgi:hypothetical protein
MMGEQGETGEMANNEQADDQNDALKLRYHYLKSQFFRTVHADGIFGGVTPRGLIQIAFFSERQPIPTAMVHTISSDGVDMGESRNLREGREGAIREVEVNAILSAETAERLQEWLGTHLALLRQAKAEIEARRSVPPAAATTPGGEG